MLLHVKKLKSFDSFFLHYGENISNNLGFAVFLFFFACSLTFILYELKNVLATMINLTVFYFQLPGCQ